MKIKNSINKKRKIILAIISMLISMLMILGYQIENTSHIYFSAWTLISFAAVFLISYFVLAMVFWGFDGANIKKPVSLSIPEWKIYCIITLVLLAFYAFQFLVLCPGLFVFDADWQYNMYIGKEALTEHHPVLHTLLMGFVIDTVFQLTGSFNGGVAIYTILQATICALCFSYMLLYVFRKTKSLVTITLSILFLGLYPTMALQVMSATKDTFFLAFLILSLTLSLELVEEARCGNITRWKAGLWSVSVVLMVIFRNNCLYAVPFLLIGLLPFFKERKKAFAGMFMGVVLLFGLYKCVVVPVAINGTVDGREMLSVPIQQMVRIYHEDGADITAEEKAVVERLFVERGLKRYHPKVADFPKYDLDMVYYKENRVKINGMYLDLVRRNFKIAVESVLENTCGFWYPDSVLVFSDNMQGYWQFDNLYISESKTLLPQIYDFYQQFGSSKYGEDNLLKMIIYSPATFFFLFVICFGYAIDQKRYQYVAIFSFVLALWLTYLLGPVALVRYVAFLFAMIPLYATLIFKCD